MTTMFNDHTTHKAEVHIFFVYLAVDYFSARHSRLSDRLGQVDQGAGQRNFTDRLPADRQLPARYQMAKIASDNRYHAGDNMQIAATCPADMSGISGMLSAVFSAYWVIMTLLNLECLSTWSKCIKLHFNYQYTMLSISNSAMDSHT